MSHKPLKLHPPLVSAVSDGLVNVLIKGQPIDHYLKSVSRRKQFGSRDRKFIASNLYEIIRYKRIFEVVVELHPASNVPEYTQWLIINHLRNNLEILNVNELLIEEEELINKWQLQLEQNSFEELITISLPDWMWELGAREYNDAWTDLAKQLNAKPVTYIRTNTLKTNVDELAKDLSKLGIETKKAGDSDSLKLLARANLSNTPLYRKGHFEFQDLASQQVATLSDLDKDMTVVDACAGAGGKTLHLAALMSNSGIIYASDQYPERMRQLEFRCHRAGVANVQIVTQDDLAAISGKADRLILDVPCTASGTIPRKPEIKWLVDQRDLYQYISIQAEILTNESTLVKPGGKLIYATCSIFKCEGEDQVVKFLGENDQFELETERRFWPGIDKSDGFYIAVMKRK